MACACPSAARRRWSAEPDRPQSPTLQGTIVEIILGGAQLLAATYFLAMTVAGFFKVNMNVVERAGTFVAAMLLMTPELITSLIGIVVGVAFLFLNVMRAKKTA